ncbi:MAG: SRPBCC family protein [Paracoccaceae bacterium]
MKFTTQTVIQAPIDSVFEMMSDFDTIEQLARRRGADVTRINPGAYAGVGLEWDVHFVLRGKARDVQLRLSELNAPNRLVAHATSPGVTGFFVAELVALSEDTTRLMAVLDTEPQTLSARLLMQSLRLAKSSLNKRFDTRVADYGRAMEDRYQSQA